MEDRSAEVDLRHAEVARRYAEAACLFGAALERLYTPIHRLRPIDRQVMLRDTDMVERAGDALIFAALISLVIRFIRRARATTSPATLGQTSCLDHYRRQLVRQRDLSRDGWKNVLPFVPGFGLMVSARALQGRPATQVMVLIVFAALLFAGVLWVIARGTRAIDREIAAIERE